MQRLLFISALPQCGDYLRTATIPSTDVRGTIYFQRGFEVRGFEVQHFILGNMVYIYTVDVEKAFTKSFSELLFNRCSLDKQT